MSQNTHLVPQMCNGAGRVALTGRFLSGTHNKDYASYILPVTAAGKDLMVYANSKGKSLGYKFTSVADGTAAASIVAPTTHIDSTVTFATAGVTGNAAQLEIIPVDFGGIVAAGGYIWESVTPGYEILKVMVNTNSGNECTVTQFNALVNGSTNFDATGGTGATTVDGTDILVLTYLTGGTAVEYAAWSAGTLTLHFTDATTTVAQAVTAINAATGRDVTAVAVGAGVTTNVLASSSDEVTDQALIGGETIGKGFSVLHTGIGTYTIVPDDYFAQCVSFLPNKICVLADPLRVVGQPLAPTSKSLKVAVLTQTSAASDLASGDYLEFYAAMTNSTR